MLAQSTKVGVGEEGKYAYQRPARVRRCGGSAPGVRPRGNAVESGRGGAVGPCRGRAEGWGPARPRAWRGWPRGRGAGARGRRRVWSPVLGDSAGAVDGAGDWGLGAPRLRFGAVEWRLRFGARAREKKGKQGLHRRVQPSPGGVDDLYRRVYSQPGGVEPLQATAISFTCLLHSRQSGGKYGSNPFTTNMSTSHVYNSSNKTYN